VHIAYGDRTSSTRIRHSSRPPPTSFQGIILPNAVIKQTKLHQSEVVSSAVMKKKKYQRHEQANKKPNLQIQKCTEKKGSLPLSEGLRCVAGVQEAVHHDGPRGDHVLPQPSPQVPHHHHRQHRACSSSGGSSSSGPADTG
jgi:hypothetical protein